MSFEQPGANFANSILFNLGALGTLALLVAWFLIYQVSVLWVRRQAPVLESLSVLGGKPVGTGGVFPDSGGFAGALATLVGTVGGPVAGRSAHRNLHGRTGSGAQAGDVYRRGRQGAGLRRGYCDRRRLDGFPPLGPAVSRSAFPRGRLIACALALALIGIECRCGRHRPGRRLCGDPGGGAADGIPGWGRCCARPGAWRWLHPGGLLTRLAVREATWFEGDVATALGALVLAVATSVGIGLMVDSFKIDFERMLTQRLAP